jgi:PEP-CTERM motif-containing protein
VKRIQNRHGKGAARGARIAALAAVICLACAPVAFGGELTGPTVISTDADTGIRTGTLYTHRLDFIADGSAATINGVPFAAAGLTGANYTTTNLPGTINESQFNLGGAGTGAAPGSGLHKLLTDFYYHGVPNPAGLAETLTLRGLTPNVPHRLRMFYRQWDANEANTRFTDISFDEGGGTGFIRVNQDESENARMLVYDYTPGPAGTLSISFLEGGNTPAASWHQYGLTNEVVPEPASAGLLGLAALGLLARRRR